MIRTTSLRRWTVMTAAVVVMASGLTPLHGQETKGGARVEPPHPATARGYDPAAVAARIKPLPLESIPDNPPPHEGALFRITHRIEPPDLILVEVLDAYPGRPITGEHLVRPDGKISLQWYGDVDVAGLTAEQAKEKIIFHMREYITDVALGLVQWNEPGGDRPKKLAIRPLDPLPQSPSQNELEILVLDRPGQPPAIDAGPKPEGVPAEKPAAELPPVPKEPRGSFPKNPNKPSVVREPVPPQPPTAVERPASPANPDGVGRPLEIHGGGAFIDVEPAKSDRVFVDVTVYNSAVYYVQGDVGSPGRLPYTGYETILDAIQFAGQLLPMADRRKIVLNRPARGEKPARSYKIDLDAIQRGEKKPNLQIFPGDRLIIGRKGDPHE